MKGFIHRSARKNRAAVPRHTTKTLAIEELEPRQLLSVNVLTYHNDLTRQGLNSSETTLTPANVNPTTFGKLFTYAVSGQVYAQPLYVSNLAIPGQGTHNVVFVATEHNDVYAFDANSNAGANGGLLWHVNLGPSAVTPNQYFGTRYNQGQYLDITPQVGVTSTPVIDLNTGTMYLDSFTNDAVGQYSHHIWALDITTGAQKTSPVLVAASIQGNGVDNVGGTITFNAKQQLQRAALTLFDGRLYVAYAGYADTDPYHGWILGFDPSTLQLKSVFNTTPNTASPPDSNPGEAGIWQAGNGLSSDGIQLFVSNGNGDFQTSVGDYGDTFLKLTPDNSTQPANKNGYGLTATDYFTPFNEQSLSAADTDLGSGGTMILPDQPGLHPHLIVGAGKQGVIYLMDRDNLGHFNSSADNVVQKVTIGHTVTSNPAYFNNTIYYHAFNDVLKAYQISNGALSATYIASSGANYVFPGATPSISSYGNSANGIVWEIQFKGVNNFNAVLRAYGATPSGTSLPLLYTSEQAASQRDRLGASVKFVVPTIADGRVFVGTDGGLTVFGLLSAPNTAPSAPTNLTVTAPASAALQVQLSWTDNAANENAYKIERSTDGVNFTQIDVASVNVTTYIDTSVTSGVTYFYRVRATNPVGDSAYSLAASATPIALSAPTLLYHFDEGGGLSAADAAGSNTATLVGTTPPAWVAGRIGAGALSFSGNGAYNQTNQSAVQTTSNLAGTLGGTSTLNVWVKTTQTGSNTHGLAPAITGVDQNGATDTNDINWGTLNASGRIGIYVGQAGGIYSTNPINDGQWHNVAMTRNASNGIVQLYVDGVLNATGAFDLGTKADQFTYIGGLSIRNSSGVQTGATYFNGQLDEVRIYNRVLTPTEIADIGRIPDAPTSLTVSTIPDSSSMLQLAWTNASSFAPSIEVQRKTGSGGVYQQIALLNGTAASYTDTGLDAGTQYFYRVRAIDLAGNSAFSGEANATVPRPQVVGRFAFYNESGYDINESSANLADGQAIAADKQALLPGQIATFQNYTNFSNGLNGIMIDVANFEGVITPDEYTLKVGNSEDPSGWQDAPEPTFVSMFPGVGVGGSTRLELAWAANAIQNKWLQVTLKADEVTNLAADDVFYFGNAIGDTGNQTSNAHVNGGDELLIRNNFTALGAAGITNPYDINRDKQVNAQDAALARAHRSGLSPLLMFTAPAATVATAASAQTAAVAEVEPSRSPEPLQGWIASLQLSAPSSLAKDSHSFDVALHELFSQSESARFSRPLSYAKPSDGSTAEAPKLQIASKGSEYSAANAPSSARLTQLFSRSVSRLKGLFGAALVTLSILHVPVDAATVTIGSHLLSGNTPNQQIPIYISGGEQVAAEDFFAQIGDGGAFVGGANAKPVFTNVDIINGTIFSANNSGAFGDPDGTPAGSNAAHPLIWVDGTITPAGTVSAAGLLATLTIDTTGITSGTFALRLTGVAASLGGFNTTLWDTNGQQIAFSAIPGTLKIAPGLTGDFNEDGAVGGADLAAWTAGFGAGPAATHGQGDGDGDGAVDGADFLIWQRQLGGGASIGAAHATPEPGTAGMMLGGFLVVAGRGRRSLCFLCRSASIAFNEVAG